MAVSRQILDDLQAIRGHSRGVGVALNAADDESRKTTPSVGLGTPETRVYLGNQEILNLRHKEQPLNMTWIRTIPASEADEKLSKAIADQRLVYPKEYADPVHPDESGGSSIVGSHTLIPDALYHAFSTFGVLMSPDLPLNRRQHEMITTVVSVTNRCKY
jgi:hypothetical protein